MRNETAVGKGISVVIPFYAVLDTGCLRIAINSILHQTVFPAGVVRDIIVVDDGSPVPARTCLGELGAYVKVIRTSNKGPGAARNVGIENASGSFVALLDSDDFWLPGKLEAQIRHLNEGPCFSFTGRYVMQCRPLLVYRRDIPSKESYRRADLEDRNPITTSSVVFSTELFYKTSGFPTHMLYGEDYCLWRDMAQYVELKCVRQPLAVYTRSDTGLSARAKGMGQNRGLMYRRFLRSCGRSAVRVYRRLRSCMISQQERITILTYFRSLQL